MSVKEMAKGITYDDPIKTRYFFPVCGKAVTLNLGWDVTQTGRDTPKPAVPRACLDPGYSQLDTTLLRPEHV